MDLELYYGGLNYRLTLKSSNFSRRMTKSDRWKSDGEQIRSRPGNLVPLKAAFRYDFEPDYKAAVIAFSHVLRKAGSRS
jgi:hypothetical protein